MYRTFSFSILIPQTGVSNNYFTNIWVTQAQFPVVVQFFVLVQFAFVLKGDAHTSVWFCSACISHPFNSFDRVHSHSLHAPESRTRVTYLQLTLHIFLTTFNYWILSLKMAADVMTPIKDMLGHLLIIPTSSKKI